MKLARYGSPGRERPALGDSEGRLRDLSSVIEDIDANGIAAGALETLRRIDPESLPLVADGERIGPPLAGIGKIVAIGLNYRDHAREASLPIPSEPIMFLKATTAVAGPGDDILLPPRAEKVDWEVELAIVIGRRARHVSEAAALDHVLGYTICNDVSERAYQMERLGQWTKGKSYDSFAPLGPWLVTPDELADPQALTLTLAVNGETAQRGTTADMIFKLPQIISYISRFTTLMPGDVIITGTPAGVGMGHKPPRFLKDGDVVTLEIEGLGRQRQRCVRDSVDGGTAA